MTSSNTQGRGMVNLDPVKLARCHCEWPRQVVTAARKALREEIKANPKYRKDNLHADVIVEQVWNAIVIASGHDGKAKP